MNRFEFIKNISLGVAFMNLHNLDSLAKGFKTTVKLPALFIGHGSPMNALADNQFTKTLNQLGKNLPKVNAILVISAHWETKGTFVTTSKLPETIYDFGGFPDELYQIKYSAPGSLELANSIITDFHDLQIKADNKMGLDHGAWTILKHLYPKADIPVLELSMDYTLSPEQHYKLATDLSKLREKGVLVIGSGNIVHNLRRLNFNNHYGLPYDWALEFDSIVKNDILEHNHKHLINYKEIGQSALMSIPSPEHYLPMLYILGMQSKNEKVNFIYEGFEYGSLSMRCFSIG